MWDFTVSAIDPFENVLNLPTSFQSSFPPKPKALMYSMGDRSQVASGSPITDFWRLT